MAAGAAAGGGEPGEGLGLLDPRALRLHRGPTGAVRATVEGEAARSYLSVSLYRAFPLSEPERWVVLLDGQGREIGTVRDPQELDPESRRIVAEELEIRYLTPKVLEVLEIREDQTEGGGWSPALIWDLATDRGRVRLRLPNLADHIRVLGPGRLLIQDREGRRVEIPSVQALSRASRAWLARYLAL
jgi:hypothetical protein